MVVLNKLLASRRFWLSVVAVFVNVLGIGFAVNPEIVNAVSMFAGILIGVYTVDDSINVLKGRAP